MWSWIKEMAIAAECRVLRWLLVRQIRRLDASITTLLNARQPIEFYGPTHAISVLVSAFAHDLITRGWLGC